MIREIYDAIAKGDLSFEEMNKISIKLGQEYGELLILIKI